MSLSQVADVTGLTLSQISAIEVGTRPYPRFETVARLARGLRISLDDLAAAVGLADAAFGNTLDGSAREVLGLRREVEALGRRGQEIADRAKTALGSQAKVSRKDSSARNRSVACRKGRSEGALCYVACF
jgi:transcriptional regulator with XRE-family HTH domain